MSSEYESNTTNLDERLRDPLYLPLKTLAAQLKALTAQGRTDDAYRLVLRTQQKGLLEVWSEMK
jgi:hypothetical protein